MKQQVITLPIEHRGHKLVISQGINAGSLKDFQVQVELLDGSGEKVAAYDGDRSEKSLHEFCDKHK